MPRDLRDASVEHVYGSFLDEAGSAGDVSDTYAIAPRQGELVAIAVHTPSAAVSVETTLDILLNDAELTSPDIDARCPDLLIDTGTVMYLDAALPVQAGDAILLQTNGETAGTPILQFTYLFKPSVSRDLDEIVVDGGLIAAIETSPNAGTPFVCPVKGKLVGVMLHPHTVIGATGNTFDVLKNTADTAGVTGGAVDISIPVSQPLDDGVLCLPDSEVFVDVGDALILQTNGEQVAATQVNYVWIVKADVRDLREFYIAGGTIIGIEVLTALSRTVVVPERCELLGVSMNVHTVIDATHTFDVLTGRSDTASVAGTAVDVVLPNATPDESGLFLPVDAKVFLEEGDGLVLRSNNEQVAATTDVDFTWHFRR